MACENETGVKNILLTFHDCQSDTVISSVSHTLSDDSAQPSFRACTYTKSRLSGRRTRVTRSSAEISISVIPERAVPIEYYQGCAGIDIQLEYFDGSVLTGRDGSVIEAPNGNFEGQDMTIIFDSLDVTRPLNIAA